MSRLERISGPPDNDAEAEQMRLKCLLLKIFEPKERKKELKEELKERKKKEKENPFPRLYFGL